MQYPKDGVPSTNAEVIPLAPDLDSHGSDEALLASGVVTDELLMDTEQSAESEQTRLERAKNWARRHKMALLLGAAGASAAISYSMHPDKTIHEVESKVPWAGGGMVVADGVNLAGIGMMLASGGRNVDWRHFWRVRERLGEVAESAHENKLFETGFWTSTTGGVGAFGVAAAAVLPSFPVESWGILTPFVADLAATVTSRVVIKQAVNSRTGQQTATSIDLPE